MKLAVLIILINLIAYTLELDNGLGLTPQMAWNSWNHFACQINETLIKETADALVSTGLAAKGYIYLNLDDCWQAMERTSEGYLQPDPTRFPSGFNNLANYIHSKGLKFGVYSDAGTNTCQDRPGSLNHEKIDAQTFANWTVDYLKYDNCHNTGLSPKVRYPPMTKALNETGRPIFFSMCEWGESEPWKWAGPLANSWRIFLDIKDFWLDTLAILDLDFTLDQYAAPGGWNDPDMLEVGNGKQSYSDFQAQFALWAILKAPLIIGCDVRNISNDTLKILANEEVIAINQDKLGQQGKVVSTSLGFMGLLQVVACQLEGNATAIAFFNRGLHKEKMKINFSVAGYSQGSASVRDVINRKDLGVMSGSISMEVDTHSVQMVKLTPISEAIYQ